MAESEDDLRKWRQQVFADASDGIPLGDVVFEVGEKSYILENVRLKDIRLEDPLPAADGDISVSLEFD